MRGNVQVIQSYKGKDKVIFREDNLVVDGFRKTICDMLTYLPPISGNTGYHTSQASSVSSYQVKAMTLGSAKDYYDKRDSRFWFSAVNPSGTYYQQLTPIDNDNFEGMNLISSVGFNQWRYDDANQTANILLDPTLKLETSGGWVREDDEPFTGWSRETYTDSEGQIDVSRFELTKGQLRSILRQIVPLRLGGDYVLYTNGRAHRLPVDFKIGRGNNGMVAQYYNFSSSRFQNRTEQTSGTAYTIALGEVFDVDVFKFKLKGHENDQGSVPFREYYVEYNLPPQFYKDSEFAPWNLNYKNPWVDLVRLELCDTSRQILRNPNFVEHQSICYNNDFTFTRPFTGRVGEGVPNAGACAESNLFKIDSWDVLNPLTRDANPSDPSSVSSYGYVKAAKDVPLENTVFSGMYDGVLLHASSSDFTQSGTVAISQQFALTREFKNIYAFPYGGVPGEAPMNIDEAFGQRDNNPTLMVYFDTMASGEGDEGTVGYLDISFVRRDDGAAYKFGPDSITNESDSFASQGVSKKIYYSAKNTWFSVGFPIILPPDANNTEYVIKIVPSGRTDANGFCNYAIKNFSLGPLAGWRTYLYDQSGVATMQYSSIDSAATVPMVASSDICSAIVFSGGQLPGEYQPLVSDPKVGMKNQIVQNFYGLEPTKTYAIQVKSTASGGTVTTAPANLHMSLKAKARRGRNTGKTNLLGSWYIDGYGGYYSAMPVSPLTPFFSGEGRRTYPDFARALQDRQTKPTDWGLFASAGEYVAEEFRANDGPMKLSMDVFNHGSENETPSGGFFTLSSGGIAYSWSSMTWKAATATPTGLRAEHPWDEEFFLPLPKERSTTWEPFSWSADIVIGPDFNGTQGSGPATNASGTTPDGNSPRGKWFLCAAFHGGTSSRDEFDVVSSVAGPCMVKNLVLQTPNPLSPAVDIWKEKYYDFTTKQWVKGYSDVALQNTYLNMGSSPTRAAVISPSKHITNMAFAGLDKDTIYQLNIIDASGGKSATGGGHALFEVSLKDVSLEGNSGKRRWIRDREMWTSEPYANIKYDTYTDGLVVKAFNGGAVPAASEKQSSFTAGFPMWDATVSHPASSTTAIAGQSPPIVTFSACNGSTQTQPWLLQNFTLGEHNIKGGDTFAFGVEANCSGNISDSTDNTVAKISVQARYGGAPYAYDFDSDNWFAGVERRELTSSVGFEPATNLGSGTVSSTGDVNNWTHIVSPPLVAPRFGPETKITASIRFSGNGAGPTNVNVKRFKVFKCTSVSGNKYTDYRASGPTFLFPEFPNPADESLQSRGLSGHPDELGHFLNRTNFFDVSYMVSGAGLASSVMENNNLYNPSITGETSMQQAVAMGAYLPSGGLFFSAGTLSGLDPAQYGLFSGVLNLNGVVNSDGYIYEHPVLDSTNVRDSSAGFMTSSWGPASSTTLRYVLTVHKDDWRYLDTYMGGIGAMGLYSIDFKKTYAKLNKLGEAVPGYQISGTGATYSRGSVPGTTGHANALYKVSEPTKNPVFTLMNKKVTFPPGLLIDYDDIEFITIIWDIDFM